MADTGVKSNVYDGLRSFLDQCEALGELTVIEDADWNLEIHTLTEATAEYIKSPPALLFDKIKDYPPGFRVLSLATASVARTALLFGLPTNIGKLEAVRMASAKLKEAAPIPPSIVPDGPVLQNRVTGADLDMAKFPVLQAHPGDGGRYVGTGDTVITKDPDSGFVNVGTYRIQMHGPDRLGLWMSPGQQGRQICQKYWDRGEAAPIVVTFGGDLLLFTASHTKFGWGVSELDAVGGIRGAPLDVITGPVTGLPIPAHAEIAIEGEVPPPDEESAPEGPFGEWPGYYSGGTIGTGTPQPVIRIKAIYHRDNPILLNMAPMWPGAPSRAVHFDSGSLWTQLEGAGVPGIEGVYMYNPYLVVVSIKQQYAGHARQAGMAVLGAGSAARNGRYVVVVDEDIDPTNIQEVLWAMETRVDPASDIHIVDDCWSTPLDPRMSPDKKKNHIHTNSRAVFFAVRPYHWRDQFPMVNRASREALREVMDKYSDEFPELPKS